MQQRADYTDINILREKIVDLAIFVGLILGIAAYLISLFNYSASNIKLSHLSDSIVILSMATLVIWRKKISISVKTIVVVCAILLLVIVDTIKLGILSENKVLLIIIPFFTYLGYNFRKSIIVFGFSIICFLAIGYLHYSGGIAPTADIELRTTFITPWLIHTLLISSVAAVNIAVIHSFYKTFSKLLEDLHLNNKALKDSEQNYREIFDNTADAIFIHDLNGKIVDVNKVMLDTYGYSRNEIDGITLDDLSSGNPGFTVDDVAKKVEEAIAKGKIVFDWQARKKSGKVFWAEVILKKTTIHGKERLLAVVTDNDEKKKNALKLADYRNHLEKLVHERTAEIEATNEELKATNEELFNQREELTQTLSRLNETQKQLTHSEKMASLGVLSAGVAHEINNPLNFIKGGVTGLESVLLVEDQNSPSEIKTLINAISEGVDRASDIVTSLNHFSRQGDSIIESCNIVDILENCLTILKNKTKNKIDITTNYCDTTAIVFGNDGQLHQAFLNILNNAIQAIPEEGEISIETTIIKDTVQIKISDTGVGMEKHVLEKITDPFFTTKEPGQGTGLGLSITYNIITDHLGQLNFESTPLEGTIVIVTLPITTN